MVYHRISNIVPCAIQHVCVFAHLCLTLCNPMDYSPSGSSVHEIFQARMLEWGAISCSRGCSQPKDWTCVSCVSCSSRWILDQCTTWEACSTIGPYYATSLNFLTLRFKGFLAQFPLLSAPSHLPNLSLWLHLCLYDTSCPAQCYL